MASRQKVALSWSGGKDSALALHALQESGRYEVVSLLTTVAEGVRRISHHGVREELLFRQAETIGLPLRVVYLPVSPEGACTNAEYERVLEEALRELRAEGITRIAHGDLHLRDLRRYREEQLAKAGMSGVFPLWQRDTTELIHSFVDLGFRAILCSVREDLGQHFAGRDLDLELLKDLPPGTDPCGENGEYHTFVHDGPMFERGVHLAVGEIVHRQGMYFVDLISQD